MRDLDELFAALARSKFRSGFSLGTKERAYLSERGIDLVLEHARTFIDQRLAPANPANDGKQTPMRNHPVFIAQHATGTCCRGCLQKWHGIPRVRELTEQERTYIVQVIQVWLLRQLGEGPQDP